MSTTNNLGKPLVSAVGLDGLNMDQSEIDSGFLQLFQKPRVDTLLLGSTNVEVLPLHPLGDNNNVLEFQIGGYHNK